MRIPSETEISASTLSDTAKTIALLLVNRGAFGLLCKDAYSVAVELGADGKNDLNETTVEPYVDEIKDWAGIKREPATALSGYVYILLDLETFLTKIGFSRKPATRFKQLNTRKKLLPLVCIRGNLDTETILHATFSKKRKEGEWFGLSGEDYAVIDEVCRHSVEHIPPFINSLKPYLKQRAKHRI